MTREASHIVQGAARRDLTVDVFAPSTPGNGAAVILLHGGGWVSGDRSVVHPYARRLAAAGFVAIAAEYRLVVEAPWPAPLDDVFDVIRWTKSAASELGIDQSKIVTMGFSAGGHLALMAAGTAEGSGFETATAADGQNAQVAAVVSFFTPINLTAAHQPTPRPPPLEALLEGGDEARAWATSPMAYVHPGYPKTFLLAGMEDITRPVPATLEFFEALEKLGAAPELHLYAKQNHEFSPLPSMIDAVVDEIIFYLRRVVISPDAFAEENQRLNMFANFAL